jgi:nicotinamide mononucleotide transporter
VPDLMLWNVKLWGQSVSYVEIAGALTALAGVYLLIRNNVWNWLWGAISCVLTGIVFWNINLFSSFVLQVIYFLPMQFYGWYLWTRGTPEKKDDLPITTITNAERMVWLILSVLFGFGWGWLMQKYFNAKDPYLDAVILGVSVAAQYLQAKRKWENWWLWLAVNVMSIYLYGKQNLYFFTGLYVIFLVMAFFGAWEWLKIMRQERGLRDALEVLR